MIISGCGGRPAQEPDPLLPVAGPRFEDELLMMCGANDLNRDLYSLANGKLQRLTTEGVDHFSVRGDTIALTRDHWPSDGRRAAVSTLGSVPLTPGRDVGYALGVAVRDARTVAFDRIVDGHGELLDDAIFVKRGDERAKRVATFRSVWDLRYTRKHGLTARVSLPGRKPALIHHVGTRRQRVTRLRGIAGNSIYGGVLGPEGQLAYYEEGRILWLVGPGGKHYKWFATKWAPEAWSPDGKRLLVAQWRKPRTVLGVMDLATGRVDELGPVACGGAVAFQWR